MYNCPQTSALPKRTAFYHFSCCSKSGGGESERVRLWFIPGERASNTSFLYANPKPSAEKATPVRTQARKIRSLARWSQAALPLKMFTFLRIFNQDIVVVATN